MSTPRHALRVAGVNFHSYLLMRTLWPLIALALLWSAGRALMLTREWRWAGDTCYSIIFFIAFLVYPGNSATIFVIRARLGSNPIQVVCATHGRVRAAWALASNRFRLLRVGHLPVLHVRR